MITLIIFIIVLGVLVFVHELGHFVIAKKSGMGVEEFGFGFPPKLFGFKKGETTYSINWIPLGGFVKIQGEDGENPSDPRSFGSKSFFSRFAVLVAGVTMNAIFAWFLLAIALMIGFPTAIPEGQQLSGKARILGPATVWISEVAAESPAGQAGIKLGDTIYKINDEVIDSVDEARNLTAQNAGRETTYVIKRGNEEMEKILVPRANPPQGEGALGIALGSVAKVAYPFYEAVPRAFTLGWDMTTATLNAFGDILGNILSGQRPGVELSGPVGIAVLTGDMVKLGFIYLLQFTAILSLNLAIINIMPFPALDGGRILFLIIEKLRGRKLPEKAEQWANASGFALLMALMVFVTIKDVGKLNLIDKIRNLF